MRFPLSPPGGQREASVSTERLIAMLWPQVRGSIADVATGLRAWQRGDLDDSTAREVAHQLAGTLGSYRSGEASRAAKDLEVRLARGAAARDGEDEDALIAAIEFAVCR